MVDTSRFAGATLTIDLGAIKRNYRRLAEMAAPAETGAVVKANAYGCGITDVVPALAEAGARTFFTALLSEAIAAREALAPWPEARVFVLNGYQAGTAALMAFHNIAPVLGSLPELTAWLADEGQGAPALHVDTGMSRLGLETGDLGSDLIDRLITQSPPAYLMTHMACADTPDHPKTVEQLAAFADLRKRFPNLPTTLANSAATITGLAKETDLARPGIALYGGRAVNGRPNPMEPVVRVDARILQTRTVKQGETVGYGATWTAPRDSRVAIVAVGYADGYLRAGSGGDSRPAGFAAIKNTRVPLIGRVSMDLIALDVTDAAPDDAAPGQTVELLGSQVTVDDVADAAGTIGYEVLTNLGKRYDRIVIDTEKDT